VSIVHTWRIGQTNFVSVTELRTKLDGNADTCVVGKHAHVVLDHNQLENVTGYNQAQGSTTFKVLSAALAYASPTNGRTVILVLHQAVHIPELLVNLLCPMQMRVNDIIVNYVPRFLLKQQSATDHALVVTSVDHDSMIIPLQLSGVTSYIPTCKPTPTEYDSYVKYDLTYETPEWDPHTPDFAEQESAIAKYGAVSEGTNQDWYVSISMFNTCVFPFELSIAFSISTVLTGERKLPIAAEQVADKWGINLDVA
jgi:hypothetical protein